MVEKFRIALSLELRWIGGMLIFLLLIIEYTIIEQTLSSLVTPTCDLQWNLVSLSFPSYILHTIPLLNAKRLDWIFDECLLHAGGCTNLTLVRGSLL